MRRCRNFYTLQGIIYVKLTRASSHTYAQLIASFRDDGSKPSQRTTAALERLDALLSTLQRTKGHFADVTTPQIRFESALSLCNANFKLGTLFRSPASSMAKARFFHEVSEAHLSKIIKLDIKSDLFA